MMTSNTSRYLVTTVVALASLALSACSQKPIDSAPMTLKDAFAGKFLVGATLNGGMLANPKHPAFEIVETHFNVVSPANALKWAPINPQPGIYDFENADRFAAYGPSHGIALIGHVLFWHSQTPDWVFEDAEGNPLDRDALLDRMRERAQMMAERYGDRVKIWDVVNESIEGDGSLRQSKFHQIIGPDFNEQAFRIAAETLPADATLLYNDYGMDEPGRREAVVAMVRDFQARGIRIDGIGMQGHWSMNHPSLERIEASIRAFASTGLPIHVTEFDIDLLGRDGLTGANVDVTLRQANPQNNPHPDGDFPVEDQERFAQRYAEIFALFLKHSNAIDRVTFWGVTDADSWLNNWPIRGRTNYSLLFDRNNQPKLALHRIIELAQSSAD